MSVYRRGKIWWIKYTPPGGGRPIRRSARTTSKREAEALERRVRLQGRVGDATTYLDALTLWLPLAPKSAHSPARNTFELYHLTLDKLPAAANRMASRMVREGLSPLTVNRRLAVVKRVLGLAYREWDLTDQPLAQKVHKFSERGHEREVFLSPEEVAELASAVEHPAVRDYVLVLAFTGLRKTELLELRPDQWVAPDIVLESKTKSKRPRIVRVVPELHDAMRWLPWPFTLHDLRTEWERARAELGMPHLRMHDLRHTCASWLAADPTVPLTVIRDTLGHSSLAVTSRYAHLRRGQAGDITQAALSARMGTMIGTEADLDAGEERD